MDKTSTEILFDKFEIISCLKKDSQAAVYLANHIFLGKKILLKTLNTEGLSDTTILERFKREAKILAQLDHPNLIKVLDFGTKNNFFYISFEYFDSRNLREVIASNNLLVEDKKLLLIQLLQALDAAHRNRIIHRDVKPENILVNTNRELKIADFGLALVINDNNLTNNSTIVGTPSYMAPEQIRGEKTQQTDLFSAGLVAFELFTGRNPVLGTAMGETINNILNFNLESCSSSLDSLPEDIRISIESMLQNDLRQRAKTAGDVLKLLGVEEAVSARLSIDKLQPERRSYKVPAIISAALLAAVLFGMVFINAFTHPAAKQQVTAGNMPNKAVEKNIPVVEKENNTDTKKASADVPGKKKNEKDSQLTGAAISKISNPAASIPGKVFIDSYPWSVVYVDNKKIDNTPISELALSPGQHKLEMMHPDYPAYTKMITVTPGEKDSIYINMNNQFGFLSCDIYPWGKIYIDGKYIGTTPLEKPVVLKPGNYTLTVKNENFSPVSKEITILSGSAFNYRLNFQELDK